MVTVKIKNRSFDFLRGFKDDNKIRASFNMLAENTFDFNFEDFYQNGYWGEAYLPYALMDNNRLVANASVNILDFMVHGEQKRFIQIGTVMTHKDYRNMGLSRFLLSTIIDEWRGQSELIYLFANDTVLDFYPKFGFNKKAEYCCHRKVEHGNAEPSAMRMDMSLAASRELLSSLTNDTLCFGQLSARRNRSLVMFYATSFMSGDFYYLDSLDAIVAAQYNESTLHINDIFCMHEISINEVIAAMATKDTTSVVLGFTPTDTAGYHTELYHSDDTLFVMGSAENIFDDKMLMFPILSHA